MPINKLHMSLATASYCVRAPNLKRSASPDDSSEAPPAEK